MLAILITGCTGTIDASGGRGGQGLDPGADPIVDGRDVPTGCELPAPGRSPLRRLTRDEYDATLRDLLGDDSAPGARLLPEENGGAYGNNEDVRSVGALLAEQYMAAAEDVAARAIADLPALLGCAEDEVESEACFTGFLSRFGTRAYRRPLRDAEMEKLTALYRTARAQWGASTGVSLVLQAMLQSPHFLYRVELVPPSDGPYERLTSWQLASRLSYLLWGTMPDEALFAAAESGALDTPEGIESEARRLLDDPRSEYLLEHFVDGWLELEKLPHLRKNAEVYPKFDDSLPPLFREESHTFVKFLFHEAGSYTEMLTAPYSMMNATLAAYYGVSGPSGEAFERVELDRTRHAGLLTHASFLATHAKAFESSPIHRGMFVRASVLCGHVPPVPDGLMIEPPDPDPNLTTRERFTEHRENSVCRGCHELLDPLGFGFENYDGIGVYRESENGHPIDASGEILGTDVDGPFVGVVELGARLAGSEHVQRCMAQQWFTFAYGRKPGGDVDRCAMTQLERTMVRTGGDLRELVLALTRTDAFRFRSAIPEGDLQ